jgi:hypothetical protein
VLRWSFVVQALPGPGVDTAFDVLNVFLGDVIEVGPFWKGAADDTVAVFNTSLLPAVAGVAEEREGSDLLVEEDVHG